LKVNETNGSLARDFVDVGGQILVGRLVSKIMTYERKAVRLEEVANAAQLVAKLGGRHDGDHVDNSLVGSVLDFYRRGGTA
jgi:hypothetical protein